MSYSDIELVQHYLVFRDEKTLQTLITRYLQRVFGFVNKIVRDKETAEDITQEVFVQMWQKLDSFDLSQHFTPWLFTIAKNRCLDWLKKKKSIPFSLLTNLDNETSQINSVTDPMDSQAEQYDRKLLSDFVNTLINTLTEKYQQVLRLHYGTGLSLSAVAIKLGYPVNTVKSWHRRALQDMRGVLAEEDVWAAK